MPNSDENLGIHHLRRNYTFGSLVRSELPEEPIPFFKKWFAELQSASLPDWFEVNAMTLSTTNAQGASSSRIVLLKQLDDEGFSFFTNYGSAKAMDIERQPHVALHFFWPIFDRQVRIEGIASKSPSHVSDSYFESRPRLSQLGAIASPQSKVIHHEAELESALAEIDQRYAGMPVPRPAHWGGYKVVPHTMEFWQGKPSRLHDRFRYQLDSQSGTWNIDRLAP